MSKGVWIFGAVLITLGVVAVVHFGLQPQPIRMIKPGYVATAEEAGFFVWKRLRHILKDERQIAFGLQNNESHYALMKSILEAAATESIYFEKKIFETRLNQDLLPASEGWSALDTQRSLPDLVTLLQGPVRAALALPSVYSSHLVGESPVTSIERAKNQKLPAITIVRMVLQPSEVGRIDPPCDAEGTFGKPRLSALGCAAQRKSTGIFRKNFNEKRFVMAMDQMGTQDYLVFLHTPDAPER